MLAGWNGATTPKTDLATDIEVARDAGFPVVELNAGKLKQYLESHSASELAELLEAAKVRPLSVGSIERVTYSGDQWEHIEQEYRHMSRVAGELGCEFIVVGPGQRPAGATDSEVKEETVSVLEALADVASGDGLKLAFQFQSFAACSVRTLDLAFDIISDLDRSDTGLVLDTFHFHAGGSAIASLRRLKASRLFIVQASDCENLPLAKLQSQNRLLPGEGVVPLRRIWQELNTMGYDRVVTVEAPNPRHDTGDPREIARQARQALETVFGPASARKG